MRTALPSTRNETSSPQAPQRRRSLRIAFVVHDYNRFVGHSRYVVELAERFVGTHQVHVFANQFHDVAPGIVQHWVPAWRSTALTSIFSFPLPASLMVGRHFDIVHAQGFSTFRADVVTAHISNARWLQARRTMEGGSVPWRERFFAALVVPAERRTLRSDCVSVIAVSDQLRVDVERLYGRTAKTFVIPHGVDHRQFHPGVRALRFEMRASLGVAGEDVVFLYVGDLRKGFSSAVEALGHVPSARLIAVSRSDVQPYKALAARHGVIDRIDFHPPTSHVERFYSAADVLLSPTPYDAFGLVITEALACGVPVITTRAAGASELVRDGIHGFLVDSAAAVDEIARAMRTLVEQPLLRACMGDAASQAMREYSWDRVAQQTLQVYYQHLDRRPC